MRKAGCTVLVAAAVAAFGVTGLAQKTTPVHPGKGGSPHVKTEWTIDGANIVIEYGKPAVKGRTDADLMPPEAALRRANEKFTSRFDAVEQAFADRQRSMSDATLEEMEAEWQRVKGHSPSA